MQLTKDDLKTYRDIYYEKNKRANKYFHFSKFQQVVEFYEKYKDDEYQFKVDFPKEHKKFNPVYGERGIIGFRHFDRWLFSYCFKEGLK